MDPVSKAAQLRAQKFRERQEEYSKDRDLQFAFRCMGQISKQLTESWEIPPSSENSDTSLDEEITLNTKSIVEVSKKETHNLQSEKGKRHI